MFFYGLTLNVSRPGGKILPDSTGVVPGRLHVLVGLIWFLLFSLISECFSFRF